MEDQEDNITGDIKSSEYDYLLRMPLWSLTQEKVIEHQEELKRKVKECDELKGTHIH